MASKAMNRWVSGPFYVILMIVKSERRMLSSLAVLQMRKSVNNVMKSCLKLRVPPFLRFLLAPHPYTHTRFIDYHTRPSKAIQRSRLSGGTEAFRWVLMFFIGICTAIVAFGIDEGVRKEGTTSAATFNCCKGHLLVP